MLIFVSTNKQTNWQK